MKPYALIDLYVPAHLGSPREVVDAAGAAGLDAVVLVADSPDELPDSDELDAINALGGVRIHAACAVAGLGYRVAVLVPEGFDGMSLDAVEASADLTLIQSAAREFHGCALSICPRQGHDGVVNRQVVAPPADSVTGVVTMVVGGMRLARDLDIEDAGAANRRTLAATGPFGALSAIGRFSTLLPAAADDLPGIIAALNAGLGMAVERAGNGGHAPRERESAPAPRREGPRGRGPTAVHPPQTAGVPQTGDEPARKRSRRRRRRRGPGDGGGGGEA